MSRALVLSVRRYSFTEDETGRIVDGCTVTFLDPSSAAEPGTDRVGIAPLTVNGPLELFSSFAAEVVAASSASAGHPAKGGQVLTQQLPSPAVPALPPLPAVFDLDFAMRPGKNNRPVLSLVAAEFVQSVDIAKLTKSAGKH